MQLLLDIIEKINIGIHLNLISIIYMNMKKLINRNSSFRHSLLICYTRIGQPIFAITHFIIIVHNLGY